MVEPPQVHELVDDDVVAHPGGHHDQSPVQTDMALTAAGSPPGTLIPDTDTADLQAMLRRQLVQPRRQLDFRRRPERRPRAGDDLTTAQPRALACHPVDVPPRERIGLAARSPARNRHAHAAVVVDAQEVAPGTAVAHEIDGCNRPLDRRCRRAEWKAQLHVDRIPDSAASMPGSVAETPGEDAA